MMRALMGLSPKRIERRRPSSGCPGGQRGERRREPPTGLYHLATVREHWHNGRNDCQDHFCRRRIDRIAQDRACSCALRCDRVYRRAEAWARAIWY